jgi:hypothetical protein
MGNKIHASRQAGRQEEASEFMKNNKKRWHDRNFRHPWMEGLVVYGSIFLLFICDSTISISFEWLVSIALWLWVFSYGAPISYASSIGSCCINYH